MNQRASGDGDDVPVRRYEYDDQTVVASDLGVLDGDVSVDLLDDRAIVVVEGRQGSQTREIELPEGTSQAFINNGVVTIEVDQ